MRFLFVSGCPRSGTTALTTILNWAPRCFLGQERFNMLFNRDGASFTPSLFTPERIRTFMPMDCGYATFEAQPAYTSHFANKEALAKLEDAEVLGDKLISLWANFSALEAPAWDGKVVDVLHIVRDVRDVAESYQARFLNEADNWQADFEKGVVVWSQSVNRTYEWVTRAQATQTRAKVRIVNYDHLFEVALPVFLENCQILFSELGLNFGNEQHDGLTLVHAASASAREKRNVNSALREKAFALVKPNVAERQRALMEMAIF